MYAVLSVIVAIFMMIGVLELISERAAGLIFVTFKREE